jgi:hypothetical protein
MIFNWRVRKTIIVLLTCLIKITKQTFTFTIMMKLTNNFVMTVYYLDVCIVHFV